MTDATPQPAAPLSAAEDQQYAALAHFLEIFAAIGPLIIWLIFKARGTKVNTEGKEALNFGINVVAIFIINGILNLILTPLTLGIWFFVYMIIWLVVAIANLIFAIMGGLKVQQGGSYRYPVNIRWIK